MISSMEPEMILEGICAPGQYLKNGAYCAPCERGTFSRGGKIVECSPCGEGYFQDEEGGDDCKPCLSNSSELTKSIFASNVRNYDFV